MSEKVPRRANFGSGLGHAWILEEVSVKYDTLEPFIQYVKFDNPEMQRAVRFGYYRLVGDKRTRILAGTVLEIKMLRDFKRERDRRNESICHKDCLERSIWLARCRAHPMHSARYRTVHYYVDHRQNFLL